MASYTCPQCGNTLKRGSWELLTHCPDCNAEWSVDPTAPARNLRKIRVFASVYTVLCLLPFAAMYLPTPDGSTLSVLLCLIPLVGAVAGILGMFWGYLAIKFRQSALGMVAMLVSATAGMVGQGAYTWWMFGQWDDHRCLTNLTTLSASIREFEAEHNTQLAQS